jgi:uncharacterized protein with GYD domain
VPTYIVLASWTDQGVKAVGETVDRYEVARSDLADRGVTIKDIYWTSGQHDIVIVVEAADGETVSAGLLRLASLGNLRTTTLRAFSADEMRRVIDRSR